MAAANPDRRTASTVRTVAGGGSACEAEACDETFGANGEEQFEAFLESQAIGTSDIGISSEPPRATALCVPDNPRRAVESFVGPFTSLMLDLELVTTQVRR